MTVEEESELTRDFLKRCEKKYRPRQVLVEFNGSPDGLALIPLRVLHHVHIPHAEIVVRYVDDVLVQVEGAHGIVDHKAYQGQSGPVLRVTALSPADKPKQDVLTF